MSTLFRLILASTVLIGTSVWAQTGYHGLKDPQEPRVQWDFNVFGAPPDGPFNLDVYYKVYNDGLSYRKENGSYVARYRLEIIVYQDDDQVAGTTFDEEYKVASFPRTLSRTDFLLNQINLPLKHAGEYKLVLRLHDAKSNQTTETSHKFRVPDYEADWHMSKFEFARLIEPAHDTSQFNKMGLIVVPSVTRSYGGSSELDGPIYAEIYGPPESEGMPLALEFVAYDELGNRALDTVFELESRGRVTPLVASLALAPLSPGPLAVEARLKVEGKKQPVLSFDDWFKISWSLATLLRTDFEGAVDQIRFLASDKERDSLLRTPDSARADVWRAFWDRRDPTPGTPLNEFQDEYYRRIRYTNAAFTVGQRPGWRTDRGMVYIQYGEPDEVERHPFDMDGYPYNAPWQMWRYYARNLQFVFVDRRGSGDYELEYPYDGEFWRRN